MTGGPAGGGGGDAGGGGGGEPGAPVPLPLDGTLDLHAFRPSDVGDLVPEWIAACHAAGLRELRIVHGKGTGALRRAVHALLGREPLVASFRSGDEAAGGWGATLVTLADRAPDR